MLARKDQEQQLLKEIQDLEEHEVDKIISMINFMKKEILKSNKEKQKYKIIQYAGMLKDISNEDAKIFSNAIERRSMFGSREIQL